MTVGAEATERRSAACAVFSDAVPGDDEAPVPNTRQSAGNLGVGGVKVDGFGLTQGRAIKIQQLDPHFTVV